MTTRRCAVCLAPLPPQLTGRPRLTCGESCKNRLARARRCLYWVTWHEACGTHAAFRPARVAEARELVDRAGGHVPRGNSQPPRAPIERACRRCGAACTTPRGGPASPFCSRLCRDRYRKETHDTAQP